MTSFYRFIDKKVHTPSSGETIRRCSIGLMFLLLGVSTLAFSQESAISPNEIYRGVGVDKNLEHARSFALKNLVEQIQVFISSSMFTSVSESNGRLTDSAALNTIARSSMLLTDVRESVVTNNDGAYAVTKYVEKASVQKMFRLRREKILEYIRIADSDLEQNDGDPINLDEALRYYYWALLLSDIYPDTISFVPLISRDKGLAVSASAGLQHTLETIIHDISFSPVKQVPDENIVWKFAVAWRGHSAGALDFEYFDGVGQSLGEVKNGEALLTFYYAKGKAVKDIALFPDYVHEENMDEILRMAHAMKKPDELSGAIALQLPGAPETNIPAPEPMQPVVIDTSLPVPIQQLLQVKNDLSQIQTTLNILIKQKKIIAGKTSEFENYEGLYAAILSKEGMIAMLRYGNRSLRDAATGAKADMKDYAGKIIVWIEVLR